MRTTLNIDTDLLMATKELAEREHKTAGQIISELLRQALLARASRAQTRGALKRNIYGFQPVPSRGGVVTNKHINNLRDELGD